MPFRKRGEVISNGRGTPGAVPGRTPAGMMSANRTLPNRGSPMTPQQNARGITGRMQGLRVSGENVRAVNQVLVPSDDETKDDGSLLLDHPGIRPSHLSGTFVTSTGSEDVDKVLAHMGLPLGSSLLIEEQGTTEFSSILAKLFAAQGIVYNRLVSNNKDKSSNSSNTHLIILSLNQGFAKELPGLYKGSKRDIKKSKISEEQSKLSVQNLNEKKTTPSRYKDFKIAWKYKLADEEKEKLNAKKSSNTSAMNDEYKDYNHQFDITARMLPAPTSSEMSFVAPNLPISTILTQIEQIIKRNKDKLIRIIIPSFLHPAMYQPDFFSLSKSVALIHGLRSIVKTHDDRCVLMATVSTDIVTKLLRVQLENLFDAILDLEPFPQDMLQFLERIYKSQPNKVQHGLLHVMKLPIFSERGEMQVKKSEWAFRNGRKRFEVEEWSIPVDDVESSNSKPAAKQESHDDLDHDHSHENETSHNNSSSDNATNPKNTKISLDF